MRQRLIAPGEPRCGYPLGGVTAVPILFFVRGTLVGLLGGTGTSAGHASTYLGISALGLPAVMLVLASQGVFRGHSDYRTPLWILLGSNVANAVIEWVLVFTLDLSVAVQLGPPSSPSGERPSLSSASNDAGSAVCSVRDPERVRRLLC